MSHTSEYASRSSDYYRQGAGVTLMYETGEQADNALERLDWVVPVVFLGAGLILFFAVVEWMAPLTPLLLFVILVWAPVSLVVVLTSSSDVSSKKLLSAVGILGIFGLPLIGWTSESYRMSMLWFADELIQADTAMHAIGDPSEQIAGVACERELESEETLRRLQLRGVLERRPDVAVECLQMEGEDDEQRELKVSIANEIFTSWFEGWMGEGPVTESMACHQTEHAAEAAEIAGIDPRPELLYCAMEAEDAIAGCCNEVSTRLARTEGVTDVDPASWSRGLQGPLFLALEEAIREPTSAYESDEPYGDNVGWSPADLWHWNAELGCHLATARGDVEVAGRRLVEMADRHCDGAPGDPLRSLSARQIVEQSCGQLREEDGQIDVDQWCEVTEQSRRSDAFAEARSTVNRARLAMQAGVAGQEIYDQMTRPERETLAAVGGAVAEYGEEEVGIEIDSDYDSLNVDRTEIGRLDRGTTNFTARQATEAFMEQRNEVRHQIEAWAEEYGFAMPEDFLDEDDFDDDEVRRQFERHEAEIREQLERMDSRYSR